MQIGHGAWLASMATTGVLESRVLDSFCSIWVAIYSLCGVVWFRVGWRGAVCSAGRLFFVGMPSDGGMAVSPLLHRTIHSSGFS